MKKLDIGGLFGSCLGVLFYNPGFLKKATQLVFENFETGLAMSPGGQVLLEFDGIHFEKEEHKLKNLNLTLNQGDNLIVLGPEGSGKDIFADLVTAKSRPQKGEVRFLGQNIHEKNEEELEIYRSCIAYISYSFGLINNLSVLENVILPLRYHTTLPEKRLVERAEFYLNRYHLYQKKELRPQKINHNEALRAAFVRAIISQPLLIFIDHAFSSQCPLALARFLDIAREDIENNHISFIMTTFDYRDFSQYAQQYLLLYQGEVVFAGRADELENTSNLYVRQYLHTPLKGPMLSFPG